MGEVGCVIMMKGKDKAVSEGVSGGWVGLDVCVCWDRRDRRWVIEIESSWVRWFFFSLWFVFLVL